MKDEVEAKKWEAIRQVTITGLFVIAQIIYAFFAFPMVADGDVPDRTKQKLVSSFFVILMLDFKLVSMSAKAIAVYRTVKTSCQNEPNQQGKCK